jgi:hypothetical protein
MICIKYFQGYKAAKLQYPFPSTGNFSLQIKTTNYIQTLSFL